jgi:hypothetical protein
MNGIENSGFESGSSRKKKVLVPVLEPKKFRTGFGLTWIRTHS